MQSQSDSIPKYQSF